ncbi:hypothetical protein C3495_09910 [Clostridiaceae bacterium 14S0207]|nr:hypothetical protein C3495_09910 [Clostridiaceae bacterium 14S0207]
MKKISCYIINLLLMVYLIVYPLVPLDNKIGKFKFNPDYVLILLIGIILLAIIFYKEFRKKIFYGLKDFFTSALGITLIIFNLLMYMSTLYAIDKRITVTQSIRFTLYIVIFFIISYVISEKMITIGVTKLGFLISIIISLKGIVQYINLKFLNKIPREIRVGSFLENPNNLGVYLIFFMFISITFIFVNQDIKKRIMYTIISFILLLGIIVCGSRNALLAVLLGTFLLILTYNKKYIIFGIILTLVLFIAPVSRNRMIEVFDAGQNSSRIKIWKSASYVIRDKETLGVGYDNFMVVYPDYVKKYPKELEIRRGYHAQHPHNIFLKVQSELGILGTISFLAMIISSLFTVKLAIKNSKDNTEKYLLKVLGVTFIVFQIMNLIDCYYNIPKIMITMFIMLGIINFYKRKGINE